MSNILEIQKHIKKTLPVSYEMLMKDLQLKIVHDLWQVHQQNISALDRKDKVMNYLMKQLEDRKTTYEGYTKLEIAEKLYNDIEQYSVLTPYLDPVNVSVEGININSWKDIRVKYFGGKSEKVQGFLNPQHGIDIIKRMLEKEAGITIDNAIPTAEASLNSNIRITALISPIVREDVGVVAYIRKLRDKVFNDDEYVQNGFATKKVLNFIHTATKRGVSTLFLGKVDTGKTTLVKHALDCLPDDMQVITIESGAREMNLVKYDEHGNVRNNVVHLLTREHTDEEKNITQEKLVVKALRLNPDILSVAEMRDIEAYAAIEASNSGHTVVSTAHAGSVKAGHKRIANLSRKKYATDYHSALIDACEAFPLGVFIHTTEDNVRRIMNISECYGDGNDEIHYNTIWQYQVQENIVKEDGSIQVIGKYVQVNNPSDNLIEIMKLYGVTKQELQLLHKEA